MATATSDFVLLLCPGETIDAAESAALLATLAAAPQVGAWFVRHVTRTPSGREHVALMPRLLRRGVRVQYGADGLINDIHARARLSGLTIRAAADADEDVFDGAAAMGGSPYEAAVGLFAAGLSQGNGSLLGDGLAEAMRLEEERPDTRKLAAIAALMRYADTAADDAARVMAGQYWRHSATSAANALQRLGCPVGSASAAPRPAGSARLLATLTVAPKVPGSLARDVRTRLGFAAGRRTLSAYVAGTEPLAPADLDIEWWLDGPGSDLAHGVLTQPETPWLDTSGARYVHLTVPYLRWLLPGDSYEGLTFKAYLGDDPLGHAFATGDWSTALRLADVSSDGASPPSRRALVLGAVAAAHTSDALALEHAAALAVRHGKGEPDMARILALSALATYRDAVANQRLWDIAPSYLTHSLASIDAATSELCADVSLDPKGWS